MCDYDMPDACSESIRQARKDHECIECGGFISKGDKYEYVSGIWNGLPDSFKTCLFCVALRECRLRNIEERCFLYGGLYEEWENDFRFEDNPPAVLLIYKEEYKELQGE